MEWAVGGVALAILIGFIVIRSGMSNKGSNAPKS